jgi:hypothetical protein
MIAKLKIKGGLEFSISKKVWENDKFKPSKKVKRFGTFMYFKHFQ